MRLHGALQRWRSQPESPCGSADPTQCAVEETEEDLEPAQIFDALIEPSRAPRSGTKEIYLFLLKPGDYTISSTNPGDYYYLAHGGSVTSSTSFQENEKYISESDESEITKYVASWPTKIEFENPIPGSSAVFGNGSSISINSSTGEVTSFKLTADGKTYSSNAKDSSDKKPYGIRWTKISYVGENNTMHYHVDGVLYDNSVTAGDVVKGKLTKTIDDVALNSSGEENEKETFFFILDQLDTSGTPSKAFDDIPLQATVDDSKSAEIEFVSQAPDAARVLTPGSYIIYEEYSGTFAYDSISWKEPNDLRFTVNSNGTIVWDSGSTAKTIENKLQEYTLAYHENAESDEVNSMPADMSDLKGYERVTIPDTVPQREGYRFLGWSTRSGATEPDTDYGPGETITIEANMNLYAVWKAVSYEKAPVLTDTVKFISEETRTEVTWISGTNYTRIFDDSSTTETDYRAYAQSGTAQLLYAVTIQGYDGFKFFVQDTPGTGIVRYVGYADDVTSAPEESEGVVSGAMNGTPPRCISWSQSRAVAIRTPPRLPTLQQ